MVLPALPAAALWAGGMLLLIRALQVLGIPVDFPALPGYGSAAILLALVDGARLAMTAAGQPLSCGGTAWSTC